MSNKKTPKISSAKAKEFEMMGNLAFYTKFNKEFFYFNYLLSDARVPPYTHEYNERAHKIGQEAQQKLTNGFLAMSQDDDQTESLEKFKTLLEVIDKAIIYERNNEISYFRQKYNTFLQTFSKDDIKKNQKLQELETVLQTYVSDVGEFSYKRFMALINIILQGYDNANAVVKYETQHLKKIDNAMKKLYSKKETQLDGLAYKKGLSVEKSKKMFQRSAARTAKHVRIHYLEQGNLGPVTRKNAEGKITKVLTIRGVKTHFKGVLSSDVKLAHWIDDRIQKILKSPELYSALRQLILDNDCLITGDYSSINNKVTQTIIKLVQQEAINRFPEILEGKYKRLTAENLIKQIDINQLMATVQTYKIEGLYPNYAMVGRHLEFFEKNKDLESFSEHAAAGLFNAFRDLLNTIDRVKKKKEKIDKETQMVQEALEQSGFYNDLDKLIKMMNNLEKLIKVYNSAIQDMESFQEKYESKREFKFEDSDGKEIIITIALDENGKVTMLGQDGKTWKEELASSSEYQKLLGDKIFNTDNLKSYVSIVKTRSSQKIEKTLIEILTNESTNYSYREKLMEALANTLQRTRVKVKGPDLSEILTAMQFHTSGGETRIEWTGPKKTKNDVITIQLTCPDGTEFHSVAEILDETIPQKVMSKFSEQLRNLQHTAVEDFAEQFAKEAGKLNTNSSPKMKDERLHKYAVLRDLFIKRRAQLGEKHEKLQLEMINTQKAMQELRELYSNAPDAKKQELERQMKGAWMKALLNSFYVSTTVKTYNQYQNDIGFIGGSLGNSVYEQITRLSDIFNSTGIPSLQMEKSDIDWLIGAVTNCSPLSVIGDKHKNIIEHYLGSMAAFALFDEGGAEAQLVAMNRELQQPKTPNILHLYKVNGIFVPGSYVLTEVKNELDNCIQQIALFSETANRGAGITIINSMHYDVLPNRKRVLETTKPWQKVSDAAHSRVSIKILFLAGLKQIVNNINKAMGNIELPQ